MIRSRFILNRPRSWKRPHLAPKSVTAARLPSGFASRSRGMSSKKAGSLSKMTPVSRAIKSAAWAERTYMLPENRRMSLGTIWAKGSTPSISR